MPRLREELSQNGLCPRLLQARCTELVVVVEQAVLLAEYDFRAGPDARGIQRVPQGFVSSRVGPFPCVRVVMEQRAAQIKQDDLD